MKHYKTKVIPTREVRELSHVTCDICKSPIEEELDEVEIERRWSDCWGAEFLTTTRYDICGECFEKEIMAFLASKGAYPEVIES